MSAATVVAQALGITPHLVADGLTAYGFDSVPTQTAPIRSGAISARSTAVRAASIDIVITSSSSEGTDFSATAGAAEPGARQIRAIDWVRNRRRGT
jgi:3-hydroxyisobutyrate dehydrogenase-like beta-hydroxyacid dehydrogenase